jgi:hypothetical protein
MFSMTGEQLKKRLATVARPAKVDPSETHCWGGLVTMARSYPRLFLATLTNRAPVDVVALNSEFDCILFKDACKKSNVSYIPTNTEDAAKLLQSQGGIGVGCYTLDDRKASEKPAQELRRAIAAVNRNHLADFMGMVTLADPVELSTRSEAKELVSAA